ncbi:PIG-L deacetylase family protein [Methanococcoides sp. NM1]|uniref:PIG-L deacetylase family protein n=1 Tax=Methanococcoides sp. NM1 TaxID=1201013 RepID=UPI001082C727|nr:PIG-L family deacetylase [Methanococcoides sp. NM1]
MRHTRNVLAIGAHADDVEIDCGGTVAKHVESGDNVILLVMAESSYTSYNGEVLRTKEEAALEEALGAKILGVELINLGFKTKEVPYSSESVEAINRVIDEYDIDTIYTHWSYDTHQDHRRTTQAVISAARYVNNIFMYEPEYPAGRSYMGFRNQYYVDISSTFDKKMEALKQHKSQVDKYGEDFFLRAVEAKARHRGYEIRSDYAECFEILRMFEDRE